MSSHAVRLNHRFVARAQMLARASSVLVMLVGALAMAGWVFDVAILKDWHGGITIKANAALALLLAGISLWLLIGGVRSTRHHRAGQALGAIVGAIGLATFSQHLFGWNLGIDQLLFVEQPGALATVSPGRMGPPASACFTLAGISLLLLHARRFPVLAQLLTIGIALIALFPITGYAYGLTTLYDVATTTGIALNTAVALFALGAGLLSSSADRGLWTGIAAEGTGGLMARRLLPFAIAVPLLLGWLRASLQNAGHLDTQFGIAGVILATIVIIAALIARTAVVVNRVEQQKIAAEGALRERLDDIETIMEVLPVGVFIATDPTASEITVNRAARDILRLPVGDKDRPLRISLQDVMVHVRVMRGGTDVSREDLPICRAARDGVTVPELELEFGFEDGSVSHGLISALPLLDEWGKPRGAIAAMMDITARKTAEAERTSLLASEQEARTQAEAANRAKDEFLAMVSHELRTPLDAILGWTRILRESNPTESARRRALATIDRNCTAQARLIEDLLDVSRVVAGNLRLNSEPVDLVEIVQAAADAVRPAAAEKKLELRMKLDSPGRRVWGDPERLQQVVWNILSNAVKFSDEGGSVDVWLTAGDADIRVVISDSGKGIDPGFLPHVFDQFRQATDETRRHGGLGLGLSIAYKLVDMHGGTLEAASGGVGRGASFTLRLPLLQDDAVAHGNATRELSAIART